MTGEQVHDEGEAVFGDVQAALSHPIDRFVQPVNRGDTKTFLAFFPKDGAVIDSGRRFGVQDAIRRWSDREFIGAHGRMTVKGIEHTLELKGRRITITMEEFQDKKWKNKIRDAAS